MRSTRVRALRHGVATRTRCALLCAHGVTFVFCARRLCAGSPLPLSPPPRVPNQRCRACRRALATPSAAVFSRRAREQRRAYCLLAFFTTGICDVPSPSPAFTCLCLVYHDISRSCVDYSPPRVNSCSLAPLPVILAALFRLCHDYLCRVYPTDAPTPCLPPTARSHSTPRELCSPVQPLPGDVAG